MLTVGISTSSGQFALALGEDNKVLYDSSDYALNDRELDEFLSVGLERCQKEVREIGQIIVDTGPAGTSRVRTGIAFANALAYSLGIDVCPVSSMELAGVDVWSRFGLPVVNTVKSIKGNAYIGLYDNGLLSIKYGDARELIPLMVKDLGQFVVIGFHRETVMHLPALKDKTVIDSQLPYGNVRFLIEKSDFFGRKKCGFPVYAQPITEQTL
jgi:tRNA A37 threonylcarbamoyladenosine modification protein TsaB